MKMIFLDYTMLKSIVSSKGLLLQYKDAGSRYELFAIEDNISWEALVSKDGGSDQTDFETNYKSTANQPLGKRNSQVSSRSDTFTTTGTGQVVSSVLGFSRYSLQVQVVGAGAVPTTWTVNLEGSLDGVNYTTIIYSGDVIGQGVIWIGDMVAPSLYIRSNCIALSLGSATSILVTILGQG
jgi:hypothetical protein